MVVYGSASHLVILTLIYNETTRTLRIASVDKIPQTEAPRQNPPDRIPQTDLPRPLQRTPSLDAWIRINAGGTITLFTGKVELGQDVRTSVAMIGADELDEGYPFSPRHSLQYASAGD
jgi:hypothetical protein